MGKKELKAWTTLVGIGSFFVVILIVVFAFYHAYVGQFADMFSVMGVVAIAFTFVVAYAYAILRSKEKGKRVRRG